ncbi:AcrR family transcriptional regulator [Microbacterium resistens]|uniref:AcrR family transcriptional regulator n=1 Tax=Microbacterium resistens TaxID=156977 RepID=A0ABU1SCU7_9MICO|nr:TetR/AcrR family transcriptional regulator [Microbacterium resistens]MDR6867431.1 AcrR family transcriptional regulator [Microbacterium resistens]
MSNNPPSRSRMSSERLAEVFGIVHELLLEVGYERLTLDAVAARARTSKATLYRQWGGKPGLVMAALTTGDARHPPLFEDVETVSLDEAFARLARTDLLSDRDVRMGFMLMHAASADPEFGAALRDEIIAPFVDQLSSVFHAAADRGEIVRDPALFHRLASVILTDLAFFPLVNGREADRADRAELFRTVIRPALDRPDRAGSSPAPDTAA